MCVLRIRKAGRENWGDGYGYCGWNGGGEGEGMAYPDRSLVQSGSVRRDEVNVVFLVIEGVLAMVMQEDHAEMHQQYGQGYDQDQVYS